MVETADYTLGIEEEYLLVDPATERLAETTDALMADLGDRLGDRISPEFLTCQIEVGTGVCDGIAAARADLGRLRRTVAEVCDRHGVAPIAASCHPSGDWRAQDRTGVDRYIELARDMRAVVRRMLIGGMHVHVGINDPERRIALINRLRPWLAALLALSCSSPYWQGRDTGLASYRLSVFDNMPRTGPPPLLRDWADWQRIGGTLIDLDLIEDRTKIWWDLRPSANFPTIELRICDMPSRLEDSLALAALVQILCRYGARQIEAGTPVDAVEPFLIAENRWRAQRYGSGALLVNAAGTALVPLAEMLADLRVAAAEDIAALGLDREMTRLETIARDGTSSDRQRRLIAAARTAGDSADAAIAKNIAALRTEFLADTEV